MTEKTLVLPIDPNAPAIDTAHTILENCFPKVVFRRNDVKVIASVVDIFIAELWGRIHLVLRSAEMSESSVDRIRRQVVLEAWNQFIADIAAVDVRMIDNVQLKGVTND
jgi:hypothetical protein